MESMQHVGDLGVMGDDPKLPSQFSACGTTSASPFLGAVAPGIPAWKKLMEQEM